MIYDDYCRLADSSKSFKNGPKLDFKVETKNGCKNDYKKDCKNDWRTGLGEPVIPTTHSTMHKYLSSAIIILISKVYTSVSAVFVLTRSPPPAPVLPDFIMDFRLRVNGLQRHNLG